MNNFHFKTCREIINEVGGVKKLYQTCKALQISKLLIITDRGIEEAGILNHVLECLKLSDLKVVVYSDVKVDPPENLVLDAVEFARNQKVNGIIGLGGGSPMDTAKIVACLAPSTQSLNEIYGVDKINEKRLPLIQIPTTAGTGSEVTSVAVVTRVGDVKTGIVSSELLADVAILDAELTVGLPKHITASTGVDAIVHAIEAYTSKLKKNPYSNMLAKTALSYLGKNILNVLKNPSNLDARQEMLFGAMLAGQAFANAPVAAVHALAYPLGGHYDISHGLSNSLVLVEVLKFNLETSAQEYAELAKYLVPNFESHGDPQSDALELIDYLEILIKECGLPTRLSDVGVERKSLNLLATDAIKQERLLVNNPRELEFKDVLNIYQSCF